MCLRLCASPVAHCLEIWLSPFSQKKINNGLVKDKNKESIMFKKTASNQVSTFIGLEIRYLYIDKLPC